MSKPILKDNLKYFFNSKKFSSLNSMYGIDKEVREVVDKNLLKQTDYLKNHFVSLSDTKHISFFDMSKSANIKPNQYYGEMVNKVTTLREYAKDLGFTEAVFMTITPPTWLKPLKQIELGKNKIKMVDNPRFSGQLDYVNQAREYESEKWTKFLNQRIFKDIKKQYGERIIFMRTYEPMIDGTPHVHIVALMPLEFVERFVKLAKNYFNETRFDIRTVFDESIGGVVYYILKYILKSFVNSKTNKLDDVGYWYAYHGIRRFSCSRTLIPMKYYRLMNSKDDFKDLLKTTKLYKNGEFQIELDYNHLKLEHTPITEFKSSDYRVSEISIYIEDFDHAWLECIYKKAENFSIYTIEKNATNIPKKIRRLNHTKPIKVQMENDYYVFTENQLIKIVPTPQRMKSYDLYRYFQSLDIEDKNLNMQHYGLVQNELIKRGLIDGYLQNINEFNTKIGA